MLDLNKRLSAHFRLGELLASDTAERHPDILAEQHNPPPEVLGNLSYLCGTLLEPLRSSFGFPIRITSGYRSPRLNELVGSSSRSQHLKGQAADCVVSDRFLSDPDTAWIRGRIAQGYGSITGEPLPAGCNANFYLYVYVCLRRDWLDVDQVIHEYGGAFGRPAWVHVSASMDARNRREMLALGRWKGAGRKTLELAEALSFQRLPDAAEVA